ncbi:HEAT repeat domain-containing protein [Archangium lansingense]|uniref:HEAT repeat domain-containing protein n=1 Tax=Archangium lansingense TaxID=2995310 RepID=A0ABT4AFB0_9BACT|nr:HEAT repeat domain-containing protein [Archangium lansinium]MCY1080373.1 HEAT repeat domain-containing protein [Archangium lansinium]
MSSALFLVLLLSAGQHGGQGTIGCWTSCQRNVQDQALRAQVCQLCVTTGRADAWVLELGRKPGPAAQEALRLALTDPDWRVRWGALRAQAKARGHTETRVLADWVAEAPAKDEVLACVTAARAAANSSRSTASFLKEAGAKGGPAAARVWARRDAVREVLEVEVYSEQAVLRGDALAHLATFLGRSPARVLLEAMARRPESGDAAAASALLSVAEKQGSSVGRMLLVEAKPPDQSLINRLFAVYSQDLEKLQKALSSTDITERRATVQSLRRYGPLAQRELERALVDTEAQVRQLAARGLAESEGLPLMEAAGRKIRADGASLATRRVWLAVAATDKTCEPFLLEVARESSLPSDTRGEAVAALADCAGGGKRRFQVLSPFLEDAQGPVRAGAVRALAMPRSPEADAAVVAAFDDSAPEVVVAALGVVSQQRQLSLGETVATLLGSPHAQVREAAARALERIGRAQHVRPLAKTLQEDSVPSVRVAAAETLGLLGGPFAASALSQALANDPDSHVQHVARRGLERLGFRPP